MFVDLINGIRKNEKLTDLIIYCKSFKSYLFDEFLNTTINRDITTTFTLDNTEFDNNSDTIYYSQFCSFIEKNTFIQIFKLNSTLLFLRKLYLFCLDFYPNDKGQELGKAIKANNSIKKIIIKCGSKNYNLLPFLTEKTNLLHFSWDGLFFFIY